MTKLSSQQEKFCLNLIEGMNQTDAYKAAGYKCANDNVAAANASELIRNPKIESRLSELRENAAEDAEVTLQWLLDKAKEVLDAAIVDRSHAASIGAIKELGILSGQRIEKSQRENINRDADQLSEEQLVAYLTAAGGTGVVEPEDCAPQPDRVH